MAAAACPRWTAAADGSECGILVTHADCGDHNPMTIFFSTMFFIFLAGFVVGIILICKYSGKQQRAVRTQSQVTYKFYNNGPRFAVLPERDAGAWGG